MKYFSEYLTWDHFYTHFHFIQVTISLIIYSHLSFGHIWALQPGRTCVTHKNPEYDFAHHESPIAQWLERSNRYSGRSWVRLPLENSKKIYFSEYLTWDHFYTEFYFDKNENTFTVNECQRKVLFVFWWFWMFIHMQMLFLNVPCAQTKVILLLMRVYWS